jgi:hypothetical protein
LLDERSHQLELFQRMLTRFDRDHKDRWPTAVHCGMVSPGSVSTARHQLAQRESRRWGARTGMASPRASDQETSGDSGRGMRSENYCREAAFRDVELIPRSVWDCPIGGSTPEPAPPSTGFACPISLLAVKNGRLGVLSICSIFRPSTPHASLARRQMNRHFVRRSISNEMSFQGSQGS